MAHNTHAGQYFDDLSRGDVVYLVYADRVDKYLVTDMLVYQALEPLSVYSDFVDMQTGEWMDSTGMYLRTFAPRDGRLVLFTCVERDGNKSWGRLVILAYPLADY